MKKQQQKAESLVWAECAAEAALSKKATDVLIIKVEPLLAIVDYFVMATADNLLHLKAVAEKVEEALREEYGIKPIGREGVASASWILLDYGDIVVHIFVSAARDFYDLEALFSDAELIAYPAL
ncbi:MAG: ribosome silencing factor [Coriobacteriales bacterium]|jgi:ribosome-associated protein|nr:ribosome silencing factor [Coriobacteriales bacterium]